MKNFFALIAIFLAAHTFGQQIKNLKSNTSLNGQTQSTTDSLKFVQIHNDSLDYKISLIDSHLGSIEMKWNWIESNPDEKVIATDEGWFDKMTIVKNELNAKKEELTLLKK